MLYLCVPAFFWLIQLAQFHLFSYSPESLSSHFFLKCFLLLKTASTHGSLVDSNTRSSPRNTDIFGRKCLDLIFFLLLASLSQFEFYTSPVNWKIANCFSPVLFVTSLCLRQLILADLKSYCKWWAVNYSFLIRPYLLNWLFLKQFFMGMVPRESLGWVSASPRILVLVLNQPSISDGFRAIKKCDLDLLSSGLQVTS